MCKGSNGVDILKIYSLTCEHISIYFDKQYAEKYVVFNFIAVYTYILNETVTFNISMGSISKTGYVHCRNGVDIITWDTSSHKLNFC